VKFSLRFPVDQAGHYPLSSSGSGGAGSGEKRGGWRQ